MLKPVTANYPERISHLKPEGAYQVLARSRVLEAAGPGIIHFEIGQPDFDMFENISADGRPSPAVELDIPRRPGRLH